MDRRRRRVTLWMHITRVSKGQMFHPFPVSSSFEFLLNFQKQCCRKIVVHIVFVIICIGTTGKTSRVSARTRTVSDGRI